jgi:hypothetical protein
VDTAHNLRGSIYCFKTGTWDRCHEYLALESVLGSVGRLITIYHNAYLKANPHVIKYSLDVWDNVICCGRGKLSTFGDIYVLVTRSVALKRAAQPVWSIRASIVKCY